MKLIYKLRLLRKKIEIRALEKKQIEGKKHQYERWILTAIAKGECINFVRDESDAVLEELLEEMGGKYEKSRQSLTNRVWYNIQAEQ